MVTWSPKATLFLPARKTKTKNDRRVPISTRLRAILEARRFDPKGDPMDSQAYAFGNRLGQQVRDVGRAFDTAVLRSHGHVAAVTKTGNLTPELRAALKQIDFHLHDLWREAGSRWLEGGVPLHAIRDWLGHATISQTSTYLSGTFTSQDDAMAAYEGRMAVQEIATLSGAEGQMPPRTAKRQEKMFHKTWVGREATVM